MNDLLYSSLEQQNQRRIGGWKKSMPRFLLGLIVFVSLIFSAGPLTQFAAAKQPDSRSKKYQRLSKKLVPLHTTKEPIQAGDWLESHEENGQTFQQYIRSQPIKLTPKRNVLYVLPLGEFDENQRNVIELSASFLEIYFGCTVTTLETTSLDDVIPLDARRVHPSWGVRQIKSTYVLEKVLPPLLPDDGVALIAFTTVDLYPDEKWNFVFGQAMYTDRVGVWSMFRNGDPETEFKTCLRRTLRIATHETGHMFSIKHCIAYECNMGGSNSLVESDRQPLYLCPECAAKIWWSTRQDPIQRYEKLAQFCRDNRLTEEVEYFTKAAQALGAKK